MFWNIAVSSIVLAHNSTNTEQDLKEPELRVQYELLGMKVCCALEIGSVMEAILPSENGFCDSQAGCIFHTSVGLWDCEKKKEKDGKIWDRRNLLAWVRWWRVSKCQGPYFSMSWHFRFNTFFHPFSCFNLSAFCLFLYFCFAIVAEYVDGSCLHF